MTQAPASTLSFRTNSEIVLVMVEEGPMGWVVSMLVQKLGTTSNMGLDISLLLLLSGLAKPCGQVIHQFASLPPHLVVLRLVLKILLSTPTFLKSPFLRIQCPTKSHPTLTVSLLVLQLSPGCIYILSTHMTQIKQSNHFVALRFMLCPSYQ